MLLQICPGVHVLHLKRDSSIIGRFRWLLRLPGLQTIKGRNLLAVVTQINKTLTTFGGRRAARVCSSCCNLLSRLILPVLLNKGWPVRA